MGNKLWACVRVSCSGVRFNNNSPQRFASKMGRGWGVGVCVNVFGRLRCCRCCCGGVGGSNVCFFLT